MNPLGLHGFAFLAFYAALATILLLVLRWWMNQDADDERLGAAAREMAQDPYSIAYLRGGMAEAAKVATIALVDRGLLAFDAKSKKLSANKESLPMLRRPIERAVLSLYLHPQTVWHYLAPPIQGSCEQYRREFLRHGLLPDSGALLQRWLLALAIMACLIATAAIKMHIALEEGRHNIGFLFVLAILFNLLTLKMAFRRTSGRGKALLDNLRVLFRRLKDRSDTIAAGGASNEAALLAAVFGITALSGGNFLFVRHIYPASTGGGSSGGDGGSGCGSSCGGGCGGGCGG